MKIIVELAKNKLPIRDWNQAGIVKRLAEENGINFTNKNLSDAIDELSNTIEVKNYWAPRLGLFAEVDYGHFDLVRLARM